ncbi:MAG: YicC family protein [Firmicutes bacterium]|nr:YicC family protein [Bacillota bacterium]
MIRSMTAYGRATGSAGGKEYTVELKSVNNRFFDCSVKIPRQYGFLEEKIKAFIQQSGISRGKLDVFIGIDIVETEGVIINLDEEYASSYISALKRLSERFGLINDITTMRVAQNRDIFTMKKPEEDMERDWEELRPILEEAIGAYNAAREREGANLKNDMTEKLAVISEKLEKIKEKSEINKKSYEEKLENRLRAVLDGLDIELDAGRILTECAIFADKIAVDEETVRLESHFGAFFEALSSDEPVGRRIDFLLQEMNREVNTIGSKSVDSDIAKLVVDCKCELEKIREQIQNVE